MLKSKARVGDINTDFVAIGFKVFQFFFFCTWYNDTLYYNLYIFIADSRFSQYSQDSFIYPTPETLFTNTYNSINIDQNTFGLIEENFSSPEMCSNGSNKYLLSQRETSQSKCTHFANSDSSSEIFIQVQIMIYLTIYK